MMHTQKKFMQVVFLMFIWLFGHVFMGIASNAYAGDQGGIPEKPVCSFDANAIWVKGQGLDLDAIRRTNPTKTTEEITGTYHERFTVHVTYRCPARDDKQEAKVLFSLGIQNPDGGSDNSSEDERFMVAGQGIIPAGMENQWAVSHGKITLGFTEGEDPPGTYILRITVVDAVSKKQVVRTTKMHLMAFADKDKS